MTKRDRSGDEIFRADKLRAAAADAYKQTFFPSPQPPPAVDREKCLYHYTSAAALPNILRSKSLWATDTAFLNDSQEISFAAEPLVARMRGHFVETLRRHVKDGYVPLDADGDIDGSKFDANTLMLTPDMPESQRLSVLRGTHEILKYYASTFRETIVEMNYSYVDGTTFVACLSEAHDDLGQWRGYGHGGYAIGFRAEELAGSADVLRPVEYGDQAIDRLCERVFQYFDQRNPGLNSDHERDGYVEAVAFCLPQIALVKHEAFRQEREWRLVVPRYNLDYTDVRVRAGEHGLVPYVECEFPVSAVAEIVIGPGGDFHSVRAVRALLHEHGYDTSKVHITHSTAPFRG